MNFMPLLERVKENGKFFLIQSLQVDGGERIMMSFRFAEMFGLPRVIVAFVRDASWVGFVTAESFVNVNGDFASGLHVQFRLRAQFRDTLRFQKSGDFERRSESPITLS